MKISPIKKIILNNKLLILFFAILISCDSMGGSNQDSTESMPAASPTPTAIPTNSPLLPPQTPPQAPTTPGPIATDPPSTPNPTPQPTQTPSTPTNPTPAPTAAPPTPQPTAMPTPSPTNPPGGPLNEFQSQVLDLVNEARAQSRNCGSTFFPAAPSVNWDVRIESAALKHSQDMALNDHFSHTGTDGSNTGDRLLMQGYNWSNWGENILVGLDDPRDAIDGWLDSPGHCSIIMSPSYEEVGAGVAQGLFQGSAASYWTLVFATES